MTRRLRTAADPPEGSGGWPILLGAIGAVQLALLALALARVIDPGWAVFDTIGTLSGLGMAGIATLVWARYAGPHHLTGAISLLAAAAGLVSAGVWFSLFGGGFFTDQYPRIILLAGADVLFALWAVVAAAALRHVQVPGLPVAMALLVLWVAVEVGSLPVFFTTSVGRDSYGVLVPALAVCFGWIVLAVWEMWLGLRLRSRR